MISGFFVFFFRSEAELFPCFVLWSCFKTKGMILLILFSFSQTSMLPLMFTFTSPPAPLNTPALYSPPPNMRPSKVQKAKPRSGHNASVVVGLLATEPGNRLNASIPTLWHSSRHTCMQDNLQRMSLLVWGAVLVCCSVSWHSHISAGQHST